MRTKLALCGNLLGLILLGAALVFTGRIPVNLEPVSFDVLAGFQSLRILDHEESRAGWFGQKIQCLKYQDLSLPDFKVYATQYPGATMTVSVNDKPDPGTKGLSVTYQLRYANEWVRDCTRSIQELRPVGWPTWAGVAKVDLDRGRGVATVYPKTLWMDWVRLALFMITFVASAFSVVYWLYRWRPKSF